jgi:hypothetical protein
VERDAERVLIDQRGRRAPVLLGRHVGRGADRGADLRERRRQRAALRRLVGRDLEQLLGRLGVVGEPRDPEVEDADPAVGGDQHVGGLEVAVDDAGLVRGVEPFAGGDEDLEDRAQRSFGRRQPLAQGLALDVLHRQEHLAVVDPDVEHRDDVGMRQPRQRLGLALHAGAPDRARLRGADDLDRDLAIELGIEGAIDHAHAAGADLIDDQVTTDLGAGGDRRLARGSHRRRRLGRGAAVRERFPRRRRGGLGLVGFRHHPRV